MIKEGISTGIKGGCRWGPGRGWGWATGAEVGGRARAGGIIVAWGRLVD